MGEQGRFVPVVCDLAEKQAVALSPTALYGRLKSWDFKVDVDMFTLVFTEDQSGSQMW